jgi:urocanate hydratase
VSIHNGGGTGWGEAINGGFGLVLDGSKACEEALRSMLHWDVHNGIARRAWARNAHAVRSARLAMEREDRLQITLPHEADEKLVRKLFD